MENKGKISLSGKNDGKLIYRSDKKLGSASFGQTQNPQVIEKFYKQIINSFGYASAAKL